MTYNELYNNYVELRNNYKKLTDLQKEQKEGKDLLKSIFDLKNELHKMDANVGSYHSEKPFKIPFWRLLLNI